MKNDLTCGVVQDLLPGVIEGLACEETRQAVARHLTECPDCAARRDAMLVPVKAAEETAREVDYLKQVRKRSAKKIALAVLCTAVFLLGAFAVKVFIIGTPLQPQSVMAAAIQEDRDGLRVNIISAGSGNAFHSWKVETVDGVASIYARDVLVSPLFHEGATTIYVSTRDVKEIWLGGISGRLIWQDGMVISDSIWRLYQARTPYVGDTSALGRIAEALGIQEALGAYSMELETSAQPYRWTLNFLRADEDLSRRMSGYYGPLMLALVDNLDEAGWTYPDSEGNPRAVQRVLPLERVNARLPGLTARYNRAHKTAWEAKKSIKDYADSPADLQRLTAILQDRLNQTYSW